MADSRDMGEGSGQQSRQGDRFAWIDPGVSVWDQWGATPPPPKVGPRTAEPSNAPPATEHRLRQAADPAPDVAQDDVTQDQASEPKPGTEAIGGTEGAPTFHQFDAELDVAELDDRLRPATTWSARATSVNRSSLTFRSRRMCYAKKLLMVAVHLIDDTPAILAGRVTACDYEGEGLYAVSMELMPRPTSEEIRQWIAQR